MLSGDTRSHFSRSGVPLASPSAVRVAVSVVVTVAVGVGVDVPAPSVMPSSATVGVALDSAKDITQFTILGVDGTIIGDGRRWDQVRFNAFPSKEAFMAVALDPALKELPDASRLHFALAMCHEATQSYDKALASYKDALRAASRLVLEVHRIATTFPDYARGTVGHMMVKPNSRNVVPGEVRMTVDLRNARDATLSAMVDELKKSAVSIERETRTEIVLREVVYFPPSEFAADLVDSVRAGSKALGYSHRDIVSGAAHDAVYMARIAPTAMVFVPCEGGISHNEIENARAEDLAAGCNVLLQAVLKKAGTA